METTITINGQSMTVGVADVRLAGRPDAETTWQVSVIDVYLAGLGEARALAVVTIRAGAYLDGTTADQVWRQGQDGARALVSLLTGRREPIAECGDWPILRVMCEACEAIGAMIGDVIRAAAQE